jgi:hypothetical protein
LEENASKTSGFYAWVLIVIVTAMVSWNVIFILIMKIRDFWAYVGEYRRLKRLRDISEIEQKYLFFDYRKFFLSSLSQ